MSEQECINFERIAEAIAYIQLNFKSQPSLDEVAEKVNLSPFHFQRVFKEWAGVTPKKFLQYISVNHAKSILATNSQSLFNTAEDVGLSGTGRLHDLFVNIEGMTPGEFKNGGENLTINYSYANTNFGQILTAATSKGLCYMGFADENEVAFNELKGRFPKANFRQSSDHFQKSGIAVFGEDWSKMNKVKLHLKGTAFQLKVWETLLKIPLGKLSTYGEIANQIEKPKAARAVGTAIGGNPIAFLIPCHRVIQSSGVFGGYMWGPNRKAAIIGYEAAQIENQN
ncbi:methylated-DNA--[protein]-cysteine S-methyltransferase [uncultured Arcticibacterium sp.]|uniref:bifunctional helix-turn-helix domain-containing protein/methylated-DNA--[protein]-cysteine S-methyltransferase n=1 Tax=uncultured Arcticibacterium sp. TaxID=2173042 RepID=UPI0030F5D226